MVIFMENTGCSDGARLPSHRATEDIRGPFKLLLARVGAARGCAGLREAAWLLRGAAFAPFLPPVI